MKLAQLQSNMLSLEPELTASGDPDAARLIAIERRDVVSIYPELPAALATAIFLLTARRSPG